MTALRIVGTGRHLPGPGVASAEIAERLGVRAHWILEHIGVASRHFSDGKRASEMGAAAVRDALGRAGLTLDDVDLLVCASGTAEQPLPCTAARIRAELGADGPPFPCFDVNATCLSFIVALEVLAPLLATGRFRRAVVVSSEVASAGIDWSHAESAALFGDGAAAVILECAGEASDSALLAVRVETYPDGVDLAEIRGGGSRLPGGRAGADPADYVFHMDGPALFKMAARRIPALLDAVLAEANVTRADLALVVPHQASLSALRIMRRKLGIEEARWMLTLQSLGNVIAASLPLGLDQAIRDGRINRGYHVLLIGTSAGYSQGALVLRY